MILAGLPEFRVLRIPVPATAGTEMTPIDLQAGYGVRGPWFELYFTNPASPLSS